MKTAFAKNLFLSREKLGITKAEAAVIIGIMPETLTAYETARAEPCFAILAKIAKAYCVFDLLLYISDATYHQRARRA